MGNLCLSEKEVSRSNDGTHNAETERLDAAERRGSQDYVPLCCRYHSFNTEATKHNRLQAEKHHQEVQEAASPRQTPNTARIKLTVRLNCVA